MMEILPTGPLEGVVPSKRLLIFTLAFELISDASRLLHKKTVVRIKKFFMSM